MTTEDFIIDLFCWADDRMKNVPNHSQAALWPSERLTIRVLFAVKGVGQQALSMTRTARAGSLGSRTCVTQAKNTLALTGPWNSPTSSNAGQSDTRVTQVWKTPAEAVDYAKVVLGDVKIETKNNGNLEKPRTSTSSVRTVPDKSTCSVRVELVET